jgi:hypothetical protein
MNSSSKPTPPSGGRWSALGVSFGTRIFRCVGAKAIHAAEAGDALRVHEARCGEDSGKRLAALQEEHEAWWEEDVKFLDVRRSRSWGRTRCISHTSHDRGQLMAMLRMLGRDVHSNRADCGYGWADAESCAYDVCISEFGGAVCWRGDGQGEGEVAG